MAADPLSELQWREEGWLNQLGGKLHENNIYYYFAASPFFDPTSNNHAVFTQAMRNPKMQYVIANRANFEAALKAMAGLEFMVAEAPAEMAPDTGTGVWVFRKQTRRKRPREEDEITVHATYFVVGENIYMAPPVAEIVGSRLLGVIGSLNQFLTTAAALPKFSPALGNTYIPPSTKLSKGPDALGRVSKEHTPLPDSLQTKKPYTATQTSQQINNKLLADTLNITMRYGDEYMDENEITGKPGDFHLSTKGRQDKEKLTVPAAASKPPISTPKGSISTPTPTPTQPPPLKTDLPLARKTNKGDKSPRTPGMPKPKRRKSKGLTSAGGMTPI